jgi:hypothetical protein
VDLEIPEVGEDSFFPSCCRHAATSTGIHRSDVTAVRSRSRSRAASELWQATSDRAVGSVMCCSSGVLRSGPPEFGVVEFLEANEVASMQVSATIIGDVAQLAEHLLCNSLPLCAVLKAVFPGRAQP